VAFPSCDDIQDRDVMRVLVECCLQEKVFNKYYTVLASKLCEHDKNHKFTLQVLNFSIWHLFHNKHIGVSDMLYPIHVSYPCIIGVDIFFYHACFFSFACGISLRSWSQCLL